MLLLLLACTKDGDTGECPPDEGQQIGTIDPACACLDPDIEVGTTQVVEENDRPVAVVASVDREITMVHGDQGGWHLDGGVRLWNTRSVVNLVSRVTHPASGVEVGPAQTHYVQLVEDDTCQGSFPGITLFLFTEEHFEGKTVAEVLSCEEVIVEICAEDSGGRSLCGQGTWFVLPDPDDVEEGLAQDCE